MGKVTAAWDCAGWRLIADDGNEASATSLFLNPGTTPNLSGSTNYRIRVLIQETNGGAVGNTPFQWQYRHVEGSDTWTDFTTSGDIRATSSSYFATDDDTTSGSSNRIGSGTYIAENNAMSETGSSGSTCDWSGNDEVEAELCFLVDASFLSSVSGGDTIYLRVLVDATVIGTTYAPVFALANAYTLDATTRSHALTGQTANLNYVRNIPDFQASPGSFAFGINGLVTGYADASDSAIDQHGFTWIDPSNAFDGSDTSYANLTINSAVSLSAEGSSHSDLGGTISLVEFRAKGGNSAATNFAYFKVYEDGGATELASKTVVPGTVDQFTDWETVIAPSGGWTWAKVAALEFLYTTTGTNFSSNRVYIFEVRVTYSGPDQADLIPGKTASLTPGSFALTGQAADLQISGDLAAETASFSLAGQASDLDYSRIFQASAGSFALTGQAATLAKTYKLQAETGAFVHSGQAANLNITRHLEASPGAFVLGAETQAAGYFDSSDAAIVDALGNWLNDSLAFDGDTGTFAEVMASSGSLYGQGTNLADLGGPISLVEFRGYGGTDAETSGLSFRAYHDGGGPFKGDVSRNGATGTGWTAWGTITAPAGGWTWTDVQALEVNIALGGLGLSYTSAHAVDVRVTYIGDDLADLKYNRVLKAETGAFALTGQTVDLVSGFNLPAESGSITLAGIDADLDLTRRMALDAGSFTLTGIDATLAKSKIAQLSPGSFALSGIDANLVAARAVSAETGALALTGQNAAFKRALMAQFDAGTFNLAGQALDLDYSRQFDAEPGSITLNGQDVAFARGIVLTVDPGAFVLTGINATLEKLGSYELPASTGSFSMAGQDALFKRALVARFDAGSFALTGIDATLSTTNAFTLDANTGTFNLAGNQADLLRLVRIDANTATFTLTGSAATLTYNPVQDQELVCEPGSFVVSGSQANLTLAAKLKANTGSFTLAGTDLGFAHDRAIKAGIGAFSYVGQATNLVRSLRVDAGTGGFTWTGIDADLTHLLASSGEINFRIRVVIPDLVQTVIIADAVNQVVIPDQAIAATISDLATQVIVQDATNQVIIQDAKTTVEL